MQHLRPIPGGLIPIPDLANVRLSLLHCPAWAGLLSFNLSRYEISAMRPPPFSEYLLNPPTCPFQWTDHHDTLLLDWLQVHGIGVQHIATISQAVRSVAYANPYHPIRDHFSRLQWDLKPRVSTWLCDYLGVEHNMYAHAVGRVFLVAAVSRVFEPGIKYDYCLILEGPQGTRKSTALRTLSEPWFAESNYELGSLNSVLSLRGVLLMELPELSALEKSQVSAIKQFLSCQEDRVRPPYGKHVIGLPRESVFAGTSNHDTYLQDETGNRRFLPIKTGVLAPIDVDALARDRDQLWAEAVALYYTNEVKCYLESEALAWQAEREQRSRFQSDPWETIIWNWLEAGHYTAVTTDQVLTNCIQMPVKDQKKGHQMQVSRCLKALGWERRQSTTGGRKWLWRPAKPGTTHSAAFSTNGERTQRVGIDPFQQDYEFSDEG